jgi:hypothetical protein
MIFDHPDQNVFKMAERHMRAWFTINESGDSFLMQPADLLQEKGLVATTICSGKISYLM